MSLKVPFENLLITSVSDEQFMGFFQIIFSRIIGRFIGLNIRFLYFKIIGRNVTYDELKRPVINKDNDFDEKGMQQDMSNALVGVATILVSIVILKLLSKFFNF